MIYRTEYSIFRNEQIPDPDEHAYSPPLHKLDLQDRMSLAYCELDNLSDQILNYYISKNIEILDLSYNCIKDLSFLSLMPGLQTLVLDRNCNLDLSTLPLMKNLEILWLNNCNIINISDWLTTLQERCPSLKQLSMMCNPVGQTAMNGVTDLEEREYRKYVISILPTLDYFDGSVVTDNQRQLSKSSSKYLLEKLSGEKVKNILSTSIAKINKSLGYVSSLEMKSNLKNKLIDGTCTNVKYMNL